MNYADIWAVLIHPVDNAVDYFILLVVGAFATRRSAVTQFDVPQEKKEDVETSDGKTAVSDGNLSDLDRKQLFSIEHWK